MHYRSYGETHVGSKRENNEDFLLARDKLGLFVVCDGMGGHAAGEVAATIAARTAERFVAARRDVLRAVACGEAVHADLVGLAQATVQEASRAVYEDAINNPEHAGMGCTTTLLLAAGAKAAMAHVGNTRLFLLRDGSLELLSTDHTMAAEMVKRGQITASEAARSRYSNAMTRCVGREVEIEVDTLALDVRPGDLFLLCSDGLTEYIEDLSDLAAHLAGGPVKELPKALIDLANERGGRDNIAAMLVEADASDEEQMRLLNLGKQRDEELEALRRVPVFSTLNFADIVRIRALCELQTRNAEDMVIEQGEACDRLCVVVDGRFSLETDGKEIRRLGAGDCIGEKTLLVQLPCHSVLRCERAGRLLLLEGEAVRRLARRRPWLGVSILLHLSQQLSRELVTAGEFLAERSAPERETLPRSLLGFLTGRRR